MKINFDGVGNPETPTLILATRNGKKLGQIPAVGITMADYENDASEIQFKVYKETDGVQCALWNKIVNFKLVWCKEWDMWFQATVELDETTETAKTVSCTQLGQAETSQIMLYDIEINTEDDIARDDYEIPTVLYSTDHPEASLLDRIMEKADHYSIVYVDPTIADIQRTFTFDSISLYDAFQEIAEEIGCIFVFHSDSNDDGSIRRAISVYDLETNCISCGYRGEFTGVCPECGGTLLNEGYGDDTTIFISADELAEEIQFTTDTGSVKNCFKLEAGDDLMTATVRNCNPNGSDYIYYLSDEMKEDMSDELVAKLDSYDELYDYYQDEYMVSSAIPSDILASYNELVTKYQTFDPDIEKITTPITGYPALMTAYYNTIDLELYLEFGLMPDASLSDTSAEEQAKLLTAANISPVAVENLDSISSYTANNAVLAMAKVVADSRYQIKVANSSFTSPVWTGNFTVTNYSDDKDTATSSTISITISDDYEDYLEQMISKTLNNEDVDDLSITALFEKDYDDFCAEIKKYCLNSLSTFYDAGQSCLEILIEQGVADGNTWSGEDPNLYADLYVPYYNKVGAVEAEIAVRQAEVDLITGTYDTEGGLLASGLQTYLEDIQSAIQDALNFAAYLGDDLWLEFCAFRREDKYSNSNYISDGLDNAELFNLAQEFIEVAKKEIYKSAELQHSISASLKDLLLTEKFWPLLDHFEVGNWIRIMVDDDVYKLRLISYEIDFDNLEEISVEFSDVMKTASGITDVQSIIDQAAAMATTYSATQRQASQGEASNTIVSNWVSTGLDVTNTKIMSGADNQSQTWDSHGMLFRKYNSVLDNYDDTQLKIINSTMAITDDNWKTVKTAVGKYYYFDPATNVLTSAYGINAEVLVGKLILGEQLGIYNSAGSMTFSDDGLIITNGTNAFTVNPNATNLLSISNGDGDIFYVDGDGVLHISGDGAGLDISLNDSVTGLSSRVAVNAEAITAEYERATGAESTLSSSIQTTADSLTSEYKRATAAEEAIENKTMHYGTCSTASTTAAKSVTCSGFTLYTGACISVYFTHKNIVDEPTLNVNGTGAKPIYAYDSLLYASGNYNWTDKSVVTFVYDGTYWRISDCGSLSKIVQTAESITLSVSETYVTATDLSNAGYATTSTVQSMIEETASSITSTVSETYVTISDLESAGYATTSTVESKISQLADSISLSVSGSLGGTASIVLSANGSSTSGSVDLGGVRSAFAADDTSAIAIEAGTITFNSNTLIVNSDWFKVSSAGKMTCTGGTIGGWTISTDAIYSGTTSMNSTTSGTYIGVSGIRQYKSEKKYVNIANGEFEAYGAVIYGDIYADLFQGSNFTIVDGYLNMTSSATSRSAGVVLTCDDSDNLLLHADGDIQLLSDVLIYDSDLTISGSGELIVYGAATLYSTMTVSGLLTASDAIYFGKGGRLYSPASQQVFFAASGESDYQIFFGVHELSSGTKLWTFCPGTDAYIRLGNSEIRWGTIYSSSSTVYTSDANEKDNIVDIDERYENLFMKLRGVNFTWKNYDPNAEHIHDRIHCGLIAQEVEQACSEVGLNSMSFATLCRDDLKNPTYDGRTERYGLAYDELHGLEIHMIQKNAHTIEELQNQIEDLQTQLAESQSRLNELENN